MAPAHAASSSGGGGRRPSNEAAAGFSSSSSSSASLGSPTSTSTSHSQKSQASQPGGNKIRQRKHDLSGGYSPLNSPAIQHDDKQEASKGSKKKQASSSSASSSNSSAYSSGASRRQAAIAVAILTGLSFLTRFIWIWHPAQVVFDEVHFGKFASYYLRGTYYFDVHPPLGKLMLAGTGYVAGYNGSYLFDKIGENYADHDAPYIALRSVPAAFGASLVPLTFGILHETGHTLEASILGASLTLLDNALIAQCRLILLDSFLIFFCIASCYTWIKFYKLRHQPYSVQWFTWLFVNGITLAMGLSVKMVGLLTIATVAVGALKDMWRLSDLRRGLSMADLSEHFLARVMAYVAVPAIIYLFWFWVHFATLTKSGPGDAFMTSKFQSTLEGSKTKLDSRPLFYGANVTLKATDVSVYLHSHVDKYPLRYDDGRVSSQGQQVTGYPHADANNHWSLTPEDGAFFLEDGKTPRPIKQNDRFRLLHCNTNGFLITHDVASPLTSTNMEFTIHHDPDTRVNETVFKLSIDGGKDGDVWRTVNQNVRIINTVHPVAMHPHKSPLPTWGFGQQEINGNKAISDAANQWMAEDIVVRENASYPFDLDSVSPIESIKESYAPSFFSKFVELQSAMLRHNAGLTKSHPYQSGPETWPLIKRGISFWQVNKKEEETKSQIYLLGNPLVWVLTGLSVLVYVGIVATDILTRRRGVAIFTDAASRHLWNASGMFFVGWALHYFPFFLMGRALFLHHYLPALVFAILLFASLFDFALRYAQVPRQARKLFTYGLIGVVASIYTYFSPTTYGLALTPQQIGARKWFSTWDFQFAPNVHA